MPEKQTIKGAKELDVLQNLRKSGAVDFDRVAEMVKNMPESVLSPGTVADDYIVSGYTSVLKIWSTGLAEQGLEDVGKIRDLNDRFQRPQL